MDLTRRSFLAAVAASAAGTVRAEPDRKTNLGILLYSFGIRSRSEKGFADPLAFLAFCHARGAAGVQVPPARPGMAASRMSANVDTYPSTSMRMVAASPTT